MDEVIVYRTFIDGVLTFKDREKKVGLEGFLEKLREAGWINGDDTVVKNFTLEYRGYAEEGNNYIEWSATLKK